ncbi:MAG: capsule assembly Wzi family protein [Treponema sp.]|jgi:hypothetical protein|nr:capsule assembly Wzi family protein [Treponema sp.]
MKKFSFGFVFCLLFLCSTLGAQQFNSVPLNHDAYGLIEMAVLRGIVKAPPSVKPWPEFTVKAKLTEIIHAPPELLSPGEQEIVAEILASFERKDGLDYRTGKYHAERPVAGTHLSLDAGLNWESVFSVKAPSPATATVNMGNLFVGGDMGGHLSWNFNLHGGFLQVDRKYLGDHEDPPYIDPKYGAYDGNPNSDGHHYYYDLPGPNDPPTYSPVYAIPAYFPYTFTKPWEAAVFPPADLGGYHSWPDKFAFAYELISEINAGFFDNRLAFRFGRMRRDWGPEGNGSSLYMNAQARPFMAIEGTAVPIDWLWFSFLTGALEYQKGTNQWSDADPFQNLFSLALLEVEAGKYIHFDFGSATVWPKRFELGYIFPINSNFFYQNNVGDFDNLALFADLEFRLPGFGKIWGSLYVDEINLNQKPFFHLDRQMYAYQGGFKINIKWLPFGLLTMRYTKVEPFCYTHEYTETPWNRVPTDTSYQNNGESLGFYLPPNSDEFLFRLESMFLPGTKAHFQYQMIHHGVDFGYGRVDGSSLTDKIIKDRNSEKYFLKDGVYQWNHVLKIGGTYSLKTLNVPLAVFAETGIVITRYTINGSAGIGNEGDYEALNDAVYRAGTGFIFSIGFTVYP